MPPIFPQLVAPQVPPGAAFFSGPEAGAAANRGLLQGLDVGSRLGTQVGEGLSNLGLGLFGEDSIFGRTEQREEARAGRLLEKQGEVEAKTRKDVRGFEEDLFLQRPQESFKRLQDSLIKAGLPEEEARELALAPIRKRFAELQQVQAQTEGIEAGTALTGVQTELADLAAQMQKGTFTEEMGVRLAELGEKLKSAPVKGEAERAEARARGAAARTTEEVEEATRAEKVNFVRKQMETALVEMDATASTKKLEKALADARMVNVEDLVEVEFRKAEAGATLTEAQVAAVREETAFISKKFEAEERRLANAFLQADAQTRIQALSLYNQIAANEMRSALTEIAALEQFKATLVKERTSKDLTETEVRLIKEADDRIKQIRTLAGTRTRQYVTDVEGLIRSRPRLPTPATTRRGEEDGTEDLLDKAAGELEGR